MQAGLPQRIDFFRLALNLGGNRAAVAEVLALFLKACTNQLRTLEQAIASHQLLSWQQTLHQMKGAAQNITAKRLANLCIEGEEITALPHEHAAAVLYHLHKELAHLREEIEEHLKIGS
jgi:HPt (histidine-containing phosphotransfer) domain-containing protein